MQIRLPTQNVRACLSRRLRGVLIALCCTAFIPALATAQTFPDKPITLVVTFAAGSGSDVVARFYAQALKESLDATAVVDIKPGGLGMIGAHAVARAAPDGYTVLIGSGTVNAANYALYRDRITYKPEQFEPVAVL